jgi:hypothetical protein
MERGQTKVSRAFKNTVVVYFLALVITGNGNDHFAIIANRRVNAP